MEAMASTPGSGASLQLVRSNTALDPVGVCLALEGRLNSADGREALAGALRQASGEGRGQCSRSSGGGGGGAIAAAEEGAEEGGLPPVPKCLSSQSHQLSGDCLSAFGASAGAHADDEALPACSSSRCGLAGGACSCPADCECGARVGRPGSESLSQQHTLLHPPCKSPDKGQGASSSSGRGPPASSSAGGAAAAAQRPLVMAAIERTSTATLDANGGVDHGAHGSHDPSCTCPPYAVKSTCGKRPNMEDTYALCPNICELPMSPMSHDYADKLPHRIAGQFESHAHEFPREQAAAAAEAAAAAAAASGAVPRQPGSQLPPPQQPAADTALQQHRQEQRQQHAAGPSEQRRQPGAPAAEPSAVLFAGAAALQAPLAVPDGEHSVSSMSSSSDGGGVMSVEKLHFFGVYDGHGGIEASQHCAQRLHYHLSKAVAGMASMWLLNSAGEEAAGPWNPEVRFSPLDTARVDDSSPGECFLTATSSTDEAVAAAVAGEQLPPGSAPPSAASSAGACSLSGLSSSNASSMAAAPAAAGGAPAVVPADKASAAGAEQQQQPAQPGREYGRSISAASGATMGSGSNDGELDSNEGSGGDSSDASAASFSGMMEEVLRDAFIKTDEEFSDSGLQAGLVGSTAVVALVGTHRVWIANCGDSRAVLSRGGKAIQVTDDHKPEREDEAERVEKAGGQVLYWNGHRVMGVLAMSRAIGDHCLRPYVIPEPEISVFARHARDELLLLASDGLWDVLSNQEATDLALRSIKRAREKGASRKAAARVAATVLTKAAVDRGSRDNITVVIIDLAPPPTPAEQAASQAAAERTAAAAAAQQQAGGTGGGCCGSSHPAQAQAPPQQQQQQHLDATLPQLQQPGDAAAAAAAGTPPTGRGSSGGGHRRHGSSSNCGSRQGSVKPASRSGSGGVSNPFAAAAASPFSTAATGSSELPLPTSSAVMGAGLDKAAAAASGACPDASGRDSAGGSTLPAGAQDADCYTSGSAFAAASMPASVSSELSACHSGDSAGVHRLVTELDSIDLSGAQAVQQRGSSSSRKQGAPLGSMAAMVEASSAAGSSTASSQLEEQPTIVDPPPRTPAADAAAAAQEAEAEADAAALLNTQPSASPFSACQGPAFGDSYA